MTRRLVTSLLWLFLCMPAWAESVLLELEWGLGPEGEILWDGAVEVGGGRLVSMKAVSFEADRHDRMTPPSFRSLTIGGGTDGMELVVAGNDDTTVRLESKEGRFHWTVGQVKKSGELRFPSRSRGKLIVRTQRFLGDLPRRLSDGTTQDSDPAACRLGNGKVLVLWRAFLGLPGGGKTGGDQIRGVLLDRRGEPGKPFDLLAAPGDVETIAVAPEGDAACRVVWAEQRKGDWNLHSRPVSFRDGRIDRGPEEPLTGAAGVDRSPALASAPDGSLVLVWQAWRDGRSAILARARRDGRWGETVPLSDGGGNEWKPAISIGRDGSVAVAWSSWRRDSYDVHLRVRVRNGWGPILAVAASDRFEAHPSLVHDAGGTVWIVHEEGRSGWGLDSHTAGLRSERNLRLRLYRDGQVLEPAAAVDLELPAALEGKSEMARLAADGHGALWLLFRSLRGPGVWSLHGSSLGDDGWSAPAAFHSGAGGQDVSMAATTSASGDLVAFWPSDHRTNQVGKDSHLYTTTLPRRAGRTLPVEGKKVSAATKVSAPPARAGRPHLDRAGRRLSLFFGDLHRHTELSVCRTGTDGSLEDAYRYAIDAAGLDFLCITDHVQHVKVLGDYDYWRSGKTADLHRVSGLHQPFHGYERSQRWPYGHRNVIGLERHPPRVPRTGDNRPWSANSGYPGERRVTPPELWERLAGQNVITIPHTSGNPVMGTDFGHRPEEMEPVVEIYQGCRISYEYRSAPDPRPTRDDGRYGGATREGGYIWDALGKGYRYGFIASSDHVATHNSYACVWAEGFSNREILEALRQRRCYAATDRIVCDVRMGDHLMGSEFEATAVPPLEVRVDGTAELDRIDVIRDNRIVFSHRPETPSRQARFAYRDLDATPGVHYYYARVIQKDRNMAWVSPIWVNLGDR